MSGWTRQQDRDAKAQGWLLSTLDDGRNEIQHLQDDVDGGNVVFDDDEDAVAFVKSRAAEGFELAIDALRFLGLRRSEADQIIADLLEWDSFQGFNESPAWERARFYMVRVRDAEVEAQENNSAPPLVG